VFILASASPRRKAMLLQEGLEIKVVPANIDESILPFESPEKLVTRLAEEKALAVAVDYPDKIVIAADTVVAWGTDILGKPADFVEARKMIEKLNGKMHSVFTGVCLYCHQSSKQRSWVSRTDVRFKKMSDSTIDDYLAVANPLDKAGAYAIQDHGELLVEEYDGLYSNVVGLPIEDLIYELTHFS
jgi:septum formation protein